MQGTVNKVNFNGKAYSAEVDGSWYGAGFNEPQFSEGDVIEFQVEQRGKFKNLQGAKTIGSASTGTTAAPKAKAGAVDPQVWIDKDTSILYQSCRKDAINFVGVLLANQAVAVPAKKSDQADAIQALVEDYSAQFFVRTKEVVEAGGCTIEDMLPDS